MSMRKLIVLALMVTSLPIVLGKSNREEDEKVILKEGRHEVTVEYGNSAGDGNTKVVVSPGETEQQISRAAASIAGVAQDVEGKPKEEISNPKESFGAGPRELICDSLGKCKHRIAVALSKAKEKAVRAEEEALEKIKDLASKAAHKVEERTEAVRQNAKEKAGDGVRETREMARATVEKVKEKAEQVAEDGSEKIRQKATERRKKLSQSIERAKEVIIDAIRYVFWPKSLGSVMGVIQILGFALAYGISMWVTFIMSRVLSGMLPRQQFGMVQTKIYPLYFKAMVGSIGLALVGHLGRQKTKVLKTKDGMLQTLNLMGSLLVVLANLHLLEPRASKVMFEKMKMEKEEGRGRAVVSDSRTTEVMDTTTTDTAEPIPTTTAATTTKVAGTIPKPDQPERDEAEAESKMAELDCKLKQLNSYSSLLNTATLMALTWHLLYLGDYLALNTC